MQSYAIAVLLLASSTLGYRDVGLMNEQSETTTTMNELDNSVYPESGSPGAVPPFPEHMPTTGCFHNIGAAQEVDLTKTNNIDTATNFPQQQLPLSDPVPPQFTPFVPPRPFNRPTPSFGPGAYGYRNYYPFNRPVPFGPPMPFTPYQRFSFPGQPNSPHPIVIVKLLQPIILPVAKPMFPEGGDRNPDVDDIDNEKYTNGFPRGQGFHRFNSNRRFAAEKYRSVERPLPYRQNTFGPYKVGGGEENIHITVKLH